MEKKARRLGDRKDGYLLRDMDSLHLMMPYILRNRADSEAFIEEAIDLTAVDEYLKKKNAENPEYKYTLFQIICAAILRTLVLRPKMNRFIAGRRIYQRSYLSIAFVAKNKFSDDGGESLLMLYFDDDFSIETVRDSIYKKVHQARSGVQDNTTNAMDVLTRLPRCILRIVGKILLFCDYYGRVPHGLVKEEPNYSSVFLTNLGSIQLNAGYHHLNNWGTNSLFLVIGEKGLLPYFSEDGSAEMRNSVKLGITLDERIADGYYYAQSIKLFRHLITHPELLERPAKEEIDYANL